MYGELVSNKRERKKERKEKGRSQRARDVAQWKSVCLGFIPGTTGKNIK
jgi:hypothetical protein